MKMMSETAELSVFMTTEGQEWLKTVLKTNEVQINFTKKDGTQRAMTCTLNPDVIPQKVTESQVIEGKAERVKSVDSLAVYDVEKQGWRSFRWDSITSVILN
jgi:hypothetical protein